MKQFVIAMILVLGFVMSCKKKIPEPVEPPVSSPPASKTLVQSMFYQMSTPAETFTVDMALGGDYTCRNATRISITPYAFLNPDRSVTEGIVTIQLKDLRSKKDMILNNAFPVCRGKLMLSESALYFDARQNGRRLKPNPDHRSTVLVPYTGAANAGMELFCAAPLSDFSETGINWIPNNSSVLPFSSPGIPPNNYAYSISDPDSAPYNVELGDSPKWFNCADFYRVPCLGTGCRVKTTGIADQSNTAVFLSIDGTSAVVRLYPDKASDFISANYALPLGVSCTIGAICFDGSNYHYASKQVSISNDMVIDLPALTKSSKTQIEINLNNLP